MLKIETRLDPVEIGGERVPGLPQDCNQMVIRAHHIDNAFVILEFLGRQITVVASELKRAIQNAENHS